MYKPVKMAYINYILLAVLIVTPFVENAPSTIKISSQDDLRTRLVFFDNNDDAVNGNTRSMAGSTTPNLQKHDKIPISATRSKQVLVTAPAYVEQAGKTEMVDENQNWGLVAEHSIDMPDDDSYYIRPVSIRRTINSRIDAPEKKTKVVKSEPVNPVSKPSACEVAIISCCELHLYANECFKSKNCSITEHVLSEVCSQASVTKTIELISKHYNG